MILAEAKKDLGGHFCNERNFQPIEKESAENPANLSNKDVSNFGEM